MDLSSLTNELKTYHRKFNKQIMSLLLLGFASKKYMNSRVSVQNKYVGTARHLKSILQPYLRGFTPKTDLLKFIPEENEVQPGKINYEITHDDIHDIEASYLGYMQEMMGSDAKVGQPLAAQIFNAILDKADEEMELDMSYNGELNPPTFPTPGNAVDIVDGIKKKLLDGIAAGKVTPFSLGTYGDTDVLDYIEEMVNSLPIAAKTKPLHVHCSDHNFDQYWYNRRAKFGANTDYNGDKELRVGPKKNIIIKPFYGMGDSKRIFITPPKNMILVQKRNDEAKRMTITYRPDEGLTRITSHFKIAFGFEVLGVVGGGYEKQLVWTNDVD